MRGGSKSEEPDAVSGFDACDPNTSEPDNACAEKRGYVQVIQIRRKRKYKVLTCRYIFRITSVYAIPCKRRGVTEIF